VAITRTRNLASCNGQRPLTPAQSRLLSYADLDLLATGAWILGTGGGGDPYYNLVAIKQLYRQGRTVRVIPPEALDDDAMVAVVSFQGAPLVNSERLPDARMMVKAIRVLEDFLGEKFDAVMGVEIGGSNALQPLVAAALMDLPVVDADGMGRAFPDVSKTSFAVRDLKPYPLSVVDCRHNSVVIAPGADWFWMERISRKVVTEIGSMGATCKAPRTGREVKQHGILHSVSKALRIGETVMRARREHTDPVEAVVELEQGLLLFRGKVVDIMRRATEGFLRGEATLEGLGPDQGHRFKVAFQNEFSVGWLDGLVRVTVPDLICLLDTVSGEAIGTETLRYGQRISVIALPSPEVYLSKKGLAHVGPRAFGFDLDFVSVFDQVVAS
jgi:DUF917 family protein